MMPDRLLAWRTAIFATLLGLFIFGGVAWSFLHGLREVRQYAASTLAHGFALRVVERFHETVGPVFMLATMVHQNPGGVTNFNTVAADLVYEFPLIRALELAPGGVVTTVYPLAGNETIIGHDLLKDRERNKEAHTALVKRQLTLAGPFELRQGGLGAVARYPVFIRDANGKSSFWGFSIAVINVPELLAIAGETEIVRAGYDHRLCRAPSGDEECKTFAQQGEGAMEDPVSLRIGLPNNNWVLSLAPKAGWVSTSEKLLVAALVVLASLLIGAGQFVLVLRGGARSGQT